MPTWESGDMWGAWEKTSLFCITTNSTIVNGKLVMGAGIAKEASQRWKTLPKTLGTIIKNQEIYGLKVNPRYPVAKLALFQTKNNWRLPATLEIIQVSTNMLNDWVLREGPERVDLNFPGIGYGGLEEKDVISIISSIPDCVHIWRR